MAAVQVVLGVALLGVGFVMIAGRNSVGRRTRRRGAPNALPTVLRVFLGALLVMNGVLQLVLALA